MSYMSKYGDLIKSSKQPPTTYDIPRLLESAEAVKRGKVPVGRIPFSTSQLEKALTERKYPPEVSTKDTRQRAKQLEGLKTAAIKVMSAYEFEKIRNLCYDWSCMNDQQKKPYRDLAQSRSYLHVREQMLGSMRERHNRDMAIEKLKQDEIKEVNDVKYRTEYSQLNEKLSHNAKQRRKRNLKIKKEQNILAVKERKRIKEIEKSLDPKAKSIAKEMIKMKKKENRKLTNSKSTIINKNKKNTYLNKKKSSIPIHLNSNISSLRDISRPIYKKNIKSYNDDENDSSPSFSASCDDSQYRTLININKDDKKQTKSMHNLRFINTNKMSD